MDKIQTTASLTLDDPLIGDVMVFALDPSGDGGFITAIFSGIDAEERALEYAKAKFTAVQRCTRQQWPYLSV